jgi:hypothetical protein
MKIVSTYEQLEAEILTLRDRVDSLTEALQESDYHHARVCNELINKEKQIEYLEYVIKDLKAG